MQYTDIVVGTDGSAAGTSAVRWAATHAERVRARLRIVCVYHWPLPGPGRSAAQLDAAARAQALAVVAAAVADAQGAQPAVDVHGTAVLGLPTDALLTEARTAALLVVGSHGRGALASALLGSVGLQIATYAAGPVVVVRGRAHTAIGPVVVGVDDTPSSDRVLEAGFAEAYRRGCALVAVRAVENDAPRVRAAAGGLRTIAAIEVTEGVARLQDRYPAVPVEVELAAGNAADVLVAAARSAQLVVLSQHGYGASLDPVTHHLLQRSDCPVLIVPGAAPA
ncbi:universal stress protein [Dactylosporangium siamense]|uniref:Universal stress protein n=1 Tax=Dactylosporangium siamense TaxID=685454 RepID=A0A919PU79_9ACTN|nr:universal stress protein [Dactylosporangium siamense]GIG50302.1 universal stress protein [Dactylosporangium siamense]